MRSRPGTAIRLSRTLSIWATRSVLKDAAVQHEPIVVTGAGCVSALGHSVGAFWSALLDGRCGLGKLEQAAPSDLKVSIIGAIPAPDPRLMLDARRLPMLDRFSVLAIVAAKQALAQSDLPLEHAGHRIGCVVGVGVAGGEAIEEMYRKIFLEGAKRANVFTVPRVMPSAPASQISMAFGIRGPVFTVSSACASSNHAIATAVWLLRNDVIVRIILISGLPAERTGRFLDPRGRFIQKPFSNDRLLGTIEQLAAG